jgi:hypothetical protein
MAESTKTSHKVRVQKEKITVPKDIVIRECQKRKSTSTGREQRKK